MDLASPPCFAHELTETPDGFVATDPEAARDVRRWRKAERERLIALRRNLPAAERRRVAAAVAVELDRIVEAAGAGVIGVYWPMRGELDLTGWMRRLDEQGRRVALPVVERAARPLAFRGWWPGCPMQRGVWDIPVPADGPPLSPDLLVVPLVGVDDDCYRLGNGGGYYDRTLAAASPRPMAVGVGHPAAGIPTIYPQPHDIPMDAVVTGEGRVRFRGAGA